MQKGVVPIKDMQNVEVTSRPRAPVLHRKMIPLPVLFYICYFIYFFFFTVDVTTHFMLSLINVTKQIKFLGDNQHFSHFPSTKGVPHELNSATPCCFRQANMCPDSFVVSLILKHEVPADWGKLTKCQSCSLWPVSVTVEQNAPVEETPTNPAAIAQREVCPLGNVTRGPSDDAGVSEGVRA